MQKPIEIAVVDFEQDLIKLVNGCGLPPFAALQVVGKIYNQLEKLTENAFKAAKEAYKEDDDANS